MYVEHLVCFVLHDMRGKRVEGKEIGDLLVFLYDVGVDHLGNGHEVVLGLFL